MHFGMTGMIMVSLPSSFLLPASTSLDPASRSRLRSDLDNYLYLLDLTVILFSPAYCTRCFSIFFDRNHTLQLKGREPDWYMRKPRKVDRLKDDWPPAKVRSLPRVPLFLLLREEVLGIGVLNLHIRSFLLSWWSARSARTGGGERWGRTRRVGFPRL
jgi:hypothetical protein